MPKELEKLELFGFQVEQFNEWHYRVSMYGSPKIVEVWLAKRGQCFRYGLFHEKTDLCRRNNLIDIINKIYE
jgi:hypothetical protein